MISSVFSSILLGLMSVAAVDLKGRTTMYGMKEEIALNLQYEVPRDEVSDGQHEEATAIEPTPDNEASLLQFVIDRGSPSPAASAPVDTPWENAKGTLGSDFGNTDHHKWNNYSIADEQNWCRHLGEHQKFEADCDSASSGECNQRFMRKTGEQGNFTQCEYNGTANTCNPGRLHVCTWTFYMHDLMTHQHQESQNCFNRLLESKRSLDGLLDSVNATFRDLMAQNDIIEAMNTTIRGLLDDQQVAWGDYVTDQMKCISDRDEAVNETLPPIYTDIMELREIADPSIRSAVDFQRDGGYQEEARDGYTAGAHFNDAPTSSFAEQASQMDLSANAAACEHFASLVRRAEKKRSVKLIKEHAVDCHAQRQDLQTLFTTTFDQLTEVYDLENATIQDNYTECLSSLTYAYKETVEGVNGIDPKIQAAARQIHAAQSRIAMLEPRLHDVENAVNKMRSYIKEINTTCALDTNIESNLYKMQQMIVQMGECPGRNDFTLTIPHWQVTAVPTPSPTPWHERLGAQLPGSGF